MAKRRTRKQKTRINQRRKLIVLEDTNKQVVKLEPSNNTKSIRKGKRDFVIGTSTITIYSKAVDLRRTIILLGLLVGLQLILAVIFIRSDLDTRIYNWLTV